MSTVLPDAASTHTQTSPRISRPQVLLLGAGFLILVLVALSMRLYTLGVPFDRDSYDEGVYWQTLRALSAGNMLYKPTFYSQPPIFLLSIFPTYLLLGQTLWAARFGVTLISLLGLLGIFLLGYALRGRLGAFIALLLLLLSPLYLSASQTIQAEGPQVAFSILSVGCAYLWWRWPNGWKGHLSAALCTLTLTLSLFSKLFALATLIPVGMLALAHIWRLTRQPAHTRWRAARSLMTGIAVMILTTLLIMLPYIGVLPEFWSGVITFHNVAKATQSRGGNLRTLLTFFLSPLGFAALFGSIIALLKKDWRVLPLLGWTLASTLLLWQQQPLFLHHLVILVPAFIALTVMGLGTLPTSKKELALRPVIYTGICLLLVIITLALGSKDIRTEYHQSQVRSTSSATQSSQQVAQQLQQVLKPDELVITDGQFVAALAGRNTPPELVDTSSVRINTHYVTNAQLIQLASQPKTKAILFYTGRLINPDLAAFRTWMPQHFRQIEHYGNGSSLWVKIQ